jgi:hypothetical protein
LVLNFSDVVISALRILNGQFCCQRTENREEETEKGGMANMKEDEENEHEKGGRRDRNKREERRKMM